jgi:hypothetical protein
MDTLFHLNTQSENEEAYDTKINLDDLYEKKQQRDMNTMNCYNKILNRIHIRIRTTSQQQNVENQFCWFIVPEMMIGIPMFDHGACTAYLIDKLRDNGFVIRYTHPNLLFISWKHWVPSYVRNEIKKKTGLIVDGHGNKVDENAKNEDPNNSNPFANTRNPNSTAAAAKAEKEKNFRDIDTYRPSGSLIYNNEILKKIETKLNRD